MTTPFDELTPKTAAERIPDRAAQWVKDNISFYTGNHWQGGQGWSGPMLANSSEYYQSTLDNLAAVFVSKNAIAEIVDRHVAGVAGRVPGRSVGVKRPLKSGEQLATNEQALIDEAEALLTAWWTAQNGVTPRELGSGDIKLCAPHEVLQLATVSALLARRGVLRLFVTPAALRQAQGPDGTADTAVVPHMPVEEAIGVIKAGSPAPTQAAVVVDKATLQPGGLYLYHDDQAASAADMLEVTAVDENGRTVILISSSDAGSQIALDLGGRLTMHEIERKPLVTEQIRQAQKALNKAKTTGSKNLDSAFLERVFFNSQMPGVTAADGTVTPAEFQVGPGTANFLAGLPIYNEQNQITGYTSPSAYFHEPTPSTVYTDSGDDFYRGILGEAGQLHVLMSGDATASGESRIQAKGEFENSLMDTKAEVDAALRWMLETVLALAAAIAGQPGRYEGLRVTADSRLDLGVVSIEEQRQTAEAYKAGLLSRETAIRRIGVDDPAAEAARLDAEADETLAVLKSRAEIMKLLVDATADKSAAASVSGFDDQTAARLSSNGRVLPRDEAV